MEPMLEEFRAVAAGLTYAPPRIPIVSNLTGQPVEEYSADYWVRHVREAVRFADGVAWLSGNGVTRFLEVGPSGVLTAMAQGCLDGQLCWPRRCARTGTSPAACCARSAALHVDGVPVDWAAICAAGRPAGRPADVRVPAASGSGPSRSPRP